MNQLYIYIYPLFFIHIFPQYIILGNLNFILSYLHHTLRIGYLAAAFNLPVIPKQLLFFSLLVVNFRASLSSSIRSLIAIIHKDMQSIYWPLYLLIALEMEIRRYTEKIY